MMKKRCQTITIAGLILCLATEVWGADVTSTLVGSGNWTDSAVWNTPQFPQNGNGGLTYDAVVNANSVTIPAATNIVIESLTLGGGRIGGEGSLTLNGASTWTGGTLAGPTAGTGQFTRAGSGPITAGGGQKFFDGAVTNAGTLLWQQGPIYAGDGTTTSTGHTFTNTGLVDLQGDGTSFAQNYAGSVANAAGGTLRRSVGTGLATITLPVENQGTFDVDTGILALSGGGSSSGVFDVASGAILDLSGNFTLNDGASAIGAGAVRFASGTLAVNGTATINNLDLFGGVVSGGVNLSGNVAWTGGTFRGVMLGGGSVVTAGGGGQKFFDGAVTNAGTLLWQQGPIYAGDGTTTSTGHTFTNTGLVDLQGDGTSFAPNFAGSVVNAAGGTLRRSVGTGAATITLTVDNQGIIDVDTGILALSGGGSSSGVFDVAAGAVLDLGTFTLNNGASSTGAGIVRIASGTVNVVGTTHLTNLQWEGGIITGGGALAGATFVSGGGQKFFDGSVTNAGTLVWQQGPIYAGSNSPTGNVFTNTGLVDLQGDGTSFAQNYAGSVVNAAGGTLRRSVGTGLATITLPVDNQGTIDVDTWILALSGGGSSSGVFDVASGAILDLSGNFTLNNGASAIGAGAVRFASGTLNINGVAQLANLEFSGGVMSGGVNLSGQVAWTGGTFRGVTLGGGAVVTAGGGQKFFDGAVTNAGTLLWQQGPIYAGDGTTTSTGHTFTNTGLVDLQGDGTSFAQNYAGSVANAAGGTLRRSVGTGLATITLPIDNQGIIDVDTGILALSGGGSSSGVFDVANGAVLDLSGNFTLNDGASAIGAGAVRFASGMLAVNGTATINNLELTGGVVSGGLNLSGNVTWTGGTFRGVTLGGGAVVTAGGGQKFFDGAVTNAGTLLWQQGPIYAGDGTTTSTGHTFTNTGLVDLQGDGTSFAQNYAGSVANAAGGTLRRSVGTGLATITLPVENQGTIEARSGTLSLSGGLVNIDVPTATLAGAAYRAIDSGGGATFSVPGVPGITTIAAGTTVELSGAGAAMQFGATPLQASLATNIGTLQIRNGHAFTMTQALNNTGAVELGGVGLNDGSLTSGGAIVNAAGATISGHGTINNTVLNSGTVLAAGGALAVVGPIDGQAGGAVAIDAAATLDLSAAGGPSDADNLNHNGTGLHLGGNNFLVNVDYDNANFGVGNAFNPRANVTGAGQILAGGGVTQTLGGSVTNGGTATATMAFGNVHVGTAPTLNYVINNIGVSGPSLRGAVQTTVGGANLTDPRIVGAGVTSNFGPIAAGANSGSRAVTFNATSAGPLTAQQMRIVNNFDNVGEQMLQITGAAYRLAAPVHSPEPVILGNRHVGDAAPSQSVSVQNNVPADGFSESLNGSIGSATGGVIANGGSFSALAPGATNNTSFAVSYSTATAGNKSGTAALTLVSNGNGSSGLGLTPLTSQTVTVTGAVYRLASAGAHTSTPVDFGIVHVGDVVTQSLTIANTAINDGFSERLNGSIGNPSSGITTNGGSFSGLAPGSDSAASLTVGVDTATAGARSGTATVTLESTGEGTSGLANTALASQTVNITATVNNFAVANFVKTGGGGTLTPTGANQYTLNLGSTVQGRGGLSTQLGVLNNVPAPADSLAGSYSLAASGYSLSGFSSFSELAAGMTQSGMSITLPSTTVGLIGGQIQLFPQSTNPRPFSLNLPTVTINLVGTVFYQADFDEDGDVDGADLTRWKAGYGIGSSATHLQGDADANGAVDGADLLVWQRQFGSHLAAPAATMIPEPSCGLLMGIALILTGRARCLKHRHRCATSR
ncbi:beta strand repeat-containing protein [Lacipirellula limnantheis]|uniref:Autotransporter-associated beta strand repeat protein n=1 Tax=Lacipirellula limnantheis TaxID=2528024 RepID=A0A517TYH7_9BACT|nr:choice-of-anchor D domain-containing protein [Lacipirellula limnantheis]QDT73430.1 hypothetical protein I41_26190 [Lacipirellula limnantheis]